MESGKPNLMLSMQRLTLKLKNCEKIKIKPHTASFKVSLRKWVAQKSKRIKKALNGPFSIGKYYC